MAADLGEEHVLLAKELGGQGIALRPRAATIQLVHHRRPAGVPQQLRYLALDEAQEPCRAQPHPHQARWSSDARADVSVASMCRAAQRHVRTAPARHITLLWARP